MGSKQVKTVLIVMAGSLFLWIPASLFGLRSPSALPSATPLQFDASRAYATIEEFVTECPNRVFGSFESRHATGYLRDSLESLGYTVDYTQFSARIKRGKQVGRNVLGYKEGRHPQIIALIAHYDTAATTVQGAMDNGSGVGVLIELARVLAEIPTNKSILICFTDGGEWGMLGAKDLATRYPERSRIAAVLSLDYVAAGALAALHLEETGLLRGATPPWYRMLALRAAENEGTPVRFQWGLREHFERTFYIPWSDQGPLLTMNIPAINLGSHSVDREREWSVYHSPLDTFDKLELASVNTFGRAAERIVRRLDELPNIREEGGGFFRLGHDRFLGPQATAALHTILFAPLPICLIFHIRNHYRSLRLYGIGRELIAFFTTTLPLLMGYLLIGLLRIMRMLPSYDLYPATAKDPVLQNPSWGIMGAILGTVFIIAVLCVLFYTIGFRKKPEPDYGSSKTVILFLMLAVAIPALLYNSYWAVTCFILPCWIWCLICKSRLWKKRVLHWAWILSAAIPGCLALGLFAARFDMGLNFIWYQILALNSGLFSAPGFFLGAAATAIGVRCMVAQLHGECRQA